MQLKVIKADGSVEQYLHTKVIGAISNVLSVTGQTDVDVAEQLADVVTYFIYNRPQGGKVTSSEIFSIIAAVLTVTGHEAAAEALSEHRLGRRLKRGRVAVACVEIRKLSDAQRLRGAAGEDISRPWDKSRIVRYLVGKHGLCNHAARAVASMVEEKVFSMNLPLVPASLVRQLVFGDTAAVLAADKQLGVNC